MPKQISGDGECKHGNKWGECAADECETIYMRSVGVNFDADNDDEDVRFD